jgi:hypothetical protein
MNDYEVLPLFSTPVYSKVINFVTEEEKNKLINEVPLDRHESNTFTQSKNLELIDEFRFRKLRDNITREFKEYTVNFLKIDENITFRNTTSWITIQEFDDEILPRNYNNSLFTAILAIDVDDGSGDIEFHKNQFGDISSVNFNMKKNEETIYNANSWKITQKKNQLLIFPSHLIHHVKPNHSSGFKKVQLFMNFYIVGCTVGEKEELLFY